MLRFNVVEELVIKDEKLTPVIVLRHRPPDDRQKGLAQQGTLKTAQDNPRNPITNIFFP